MRRSKRTVTPGETGAARLGGAGAADAGERDVSYFDKEENTAGALTSFLSTETTRVAGLSGVTLGTIMNVLTTLVASLIIALAIGWKLALVCIHIRVRKHIRRGRSGAARGRGGRGRGGDEYRGI